MPVHYTVEYVEQRAHSGHSCQRHVGIFCFHLLFLGFGDVFGKRVGVDVGAGWHYRCGDHGRHKVSVYFIHCCRVSYDDMYGIGD